MTLNVRSFGVLGPLLTTLLLPLSALVAADPTPAVVVASARDPYERLPTAILVVPRVAYDLPEAIRSNLVPLGDAVVAALSARMPGVDVLRRSDELPLGIEGSAGGIVEMLVTTEYASYEETGPSGMTTPLLNAIPTQLKVHLLGRRGYAGDVGLDIRMDASKESPQQVNRLALRDLSQQHASFLVAGVVDKMHAGIIAWDPADLPQRLAAVQPPKGQPPLIAVSCATVIGKERTKQSSMIFAETGSRELYADMIYLLGRRLGPVRLTTDAKASVDASVKIVNTVWYESYGTQQGAFVTNNGSLPYRCEMLVTLTSATAHRWSGAHTYRAAVELPTQVTRSGGFASEATRIVSAMSGQIGDQLEGELALQRSYRAPGEGEVDEYLIRMNPINDSAVDAVQKSRWMQGMPAKLQSVLAKHVAPAKLVTASQATVGRVAGVVTVTVDGKFVNVAYPDGKKAIEPNEIKLNLQLQSCYSENPNSWEGEHTAVLTFDRAERMKITQRKPTVDASEILLDKLIKSAFP